MIGSHILGAFFMISVIIPVFNREETIKRALESVFNQTYKDFEVIIIDDGSTDKTLSLAKEFPVEIITQNNHGVSHARNRGIEKARGEYIALLDSDDEWLPKKLELQIAKQSICCHTEEIWIRDGVRVNQMKKHKKGGGDQFIPSLGLCLISPSSVLLKREVFDEIGMFREDYPVCEDYDLWLKLTSLYEIDFIDTPLIKKYGGHEDQLSRKFFAMDYWRIKSIDWILQNRKLSSQQREACLKVLAKKTRVLLNGYQKHQNMDNFSEIQSIRSTYFS